jgi:hypothetical protein
MNKLNIFKSLYFAVTFCSLLVSSSLSAQPYASDEMTIPKVAILDRGPASPPPPPPTPRPSGN